MARRLALLSLLGLLCGCTATVEQRYFAPAFVGLTVGARGEESIPVPDAAWGETLRTLGEDEQTARLLSRAFGGARVRLSVLDPAAADGDLFAPLPEDVDVGLRVRERKGSVEAIRAGTFELTSELELTVLSRGVGLGRGGDPVEVGLDAYLIPILLALEDDIRRDRPEWEVVTTTAVRPVSEGSTHEEDIARRAEEYRERYRWRRD